MSTSDNMRDSEPPFIVIWETTRACWLACAHCRATAQREPLPGELTTREAEDLIDQIAAMRTRVLVFSGGDPLLRADLPALIRHAKARGLRVGTIPAATPRVTREALAELAAAGIDQVAFSLDASTAAAHDAFRGVAGTFDVVRQGIRWAHELGLPVQVNTVFGAFNRGDVDAMIALVRQLGVVFWEVFFLVPVGRASALDGLGAEEVEAVFGKLAAVGREDRFVVKVTEAPHYRRYLMTRRQAGQALGLGRHWVEAGHGRIGVAPRPINAGKGHLFVSCQGDICPSGFLPVAAGNIRRDRLDAVYGDAPIFRQLRDPSLLKGRCGRCEFRAACGGSRARAWAMTGDYLAEDPACAYDSSRAPASAEARHG
jgi:radical SAM protein